jgi:hypothetical protein
MFYAGLGLGYGIHTGEEEVEYSYYRDGPKHKHDTIVERNGFGIVPEIGWKIDLGNPSGFFLNPHVQLPLIIGKRTWSYYYSDDDDAVGVSVGFRLALGAGWVF